MRYLYLSSIFVYCALAAPTQQDPWHRLVLPADKTTADLPPLPIADKAILDNLTILPFVDFKGTPLPTQPVVTPTLQDGKLLLNLTDIYFWGQAKLQFQFGSNPVETYILRRGPHVTPTDVDLQPNEPAQLWLYNFEKQPVKLKWRFISGTNSVCGVESNGQPRQDCSAPANWSTANVAAMRSDAIRFTIPDWWFTSSHGFSDDVRQVDLELRFGAEDSGPLLRVPVKLHLHAHILPSWIASISGIVQHLLWVTFWVTLGAVCLMLAQVMIPNFRQCLRMEGDLETLQERLRNISSRVGDRLYTRCHRELESIRTGLAMGQAASAKKGMFSGLFSWKRVALAGNTVEVNRLASSLPRIESRIRLTERFDEFQSSGTDPDEGAVPPSLCWNRTNQIRNLQAILARQFITDTDEKSASTNLDLLADVDASTKKVAAELETRLVGIRRQLELEPWKTMRVDFIKGLNGCAELLAKDPPDVPDGGWSSEELILRDLTAIRLDVITEMMVLEPLLKANPTVKDAIFAKLQSGDPHTLADATNDLLKLSQGISEKDVQAALEGGMWDAYYEPASVSITDLDILRVSLELRNKALERSAAKNSFQCFWKLSATDQAGVTNESYEAGWKAQIMPMLGKITVTPEVYDVDGKKIVIRPATATPGKDEKGVISLDVVRPPANALSARLVRGLIDAAITAVVPVITVALTQAQNGGDLTLDKLVLLGFTSQAIRAAVVPDSTVPTRSEPRP